MVLRKHPIITRKQNTFLIYFVCLCLRKQELSLSSCMQKLQLIQFFLFITNKLVFALHIGDYIQITKLSFLFFYFLFTFFQQKEKARLRFPTFFASSSSGTCGDSFTLYLLFFFTSIGLCSHLCFVHNSVFFFLVSNNGLSIWYNGFFPLFVLHL